ncbi:hypothetical protein Tco_0638207, partial [Tanacetum coccineum]
GKVYDDEEMVQVKVLMALANDELAVGNNYARNGERIDITIRKVNILLSMDEDADCQTYLKYINIDLKFVEEQRYKALMNELVNDGVKLSKLEINTGFINGLQKKWLSFCQSLRNTNHVKDFEHASLFGKLKYEENLIDSIYETKKKKSLSNAITLSTAFISTSIVQDFQDSPDDEEDTRSSLEYMNDLEE